MGGEVGLGEAPLDFTSRPAESQTYRVRFGDEGGREAAQIQGDVTGVTESSINPDLTEFSSLARPQDVIAGPAVAGIDAGTGEEGVVARSADEPVASVGPR